MGLGFAVNDVGDNVTAAVRRSTVRSDNGDITIDATFAKPTDLPPGLDAQIAALAVSGSGGKSISPLSPCHISK